MWLRIWEVPQTLLKRTKWFAGNYLPLSPIQAASGMSETPA